MSVFQPHKQSWQSWPRTASNLQAPLFTVMRRGYHPQQVDGYVAELAARLATAERARVQLEREVAAVRNQPPSFERLGMDMAEVLEHAGRAAELLVDRAQGRAEAIVAEAQTQAADLIGVAEQQAGQLDAAARQRLVEVRVETEQVREFGDGLARHLGRVRADIDALLNSVSTPGEQVLAAAGAAHEPGLDAALALTAEEAQGTVAPARKTSPASASMAASPTSPSSPTTTSGFGSRKSAERPTSAPKSTTSP